ncbi:MAG TPA: response regulator [Syntrophorhabdaceae bacterium]|nr:response regulator [Syntrophorhabdaceae bacterium]
MGLHIMLVDSDEDVIHVTAEMLERMGHSVQAERIVQTALRMFSKDPDRFDLAIIEPVMPEPGGVELGIQLGRLKPGFPVLFYTGYLDPQLEDVIKDAGVGKTILKPLTSRELEKAIEECCVVLHLKIA